MRTHDLVRRTLGRFAQPAEGLYPPGILGHDAGRRRTPLAREKAEELLKRSSLKRPLKLRASVHPILQDRYHSLTAALLKTWADVGVSVSIVTPTLSSYLDRFTASEDVDLLIGRWNADYDDPDNFTYTLFNSRTGRFRSYISMPKLDQFMEEARSESQPAAREALYGKIEASLLDSAQMLPLFHDEGAGIVPWLASEFSAEDGGRRFRFKLREGVRFHDGRRLTARDVRYSYERLLQNAESDSRWTLATVKGAEALMKGEADRLEGLRIVSSMEFTIDLEKPISLFPALLAFLSTAIVPEGSEDFSGSYRDGCAGTGPFRVVRFDAGSRVELEANPDYWRPGLPKSNGLVFTLGVSPADILAGFKSSRFALAWNLRPPDVEALRQDRTLDAQFRVTPSLSTYYIVFNRHHGPLNDVRRRRRLVRSVDVGSLVRRHLGRLAIPAHGLIPPGLLGHEPPTRRETSPPPAVSSTEARVALTAVIHSMYQGPYAELTKDIFAAFRDAGFAIEVLDVNETRAEYRDVVGSAAADLSMNRWVADYADADTFIYGLLHSQDGLVGRFAGGPELDALIARGRSETSPDVRHSIYREAEEKIAHEALLLPLFYEQAYRFARPEVKGFEVGFSLPFIVYEKLWIKR